MPSLSSLSVFQVMPYLTVLTLRSEISRKMGSAISNIQLTRINLAGRNMQIGFYISGKDFFTMAQTNFTGGSDILADGDWRPK